VIGGLETVEKLSIFVIFNKNRFCAVKNLIVFLENKTNLVIVVDMPQMLPGSAD
jgi:hypothetical protein